MSTAKYAHVTAPKQLTISEEPVPEPAADGVIVDVAYTGICGTDVHGYQSPDFLPPAVFGHEWTGTVRAVGSAVTTVEAGQRVIASVGTACGRCAACRAGFADMCELVFAEANGIDDTAPVHGAFATSIAVSQRRIQPVLDGLTDAQAGLVEPTAVTFHAVKRTRQPLGALVVVQGAGPIGLLTAQHARHAGARDVVVVELNEARRRTATELGFPAVFAPGDDFTRHLEQATGGLGADVLYECTGAPGLLQSSAELVRRGGVLSLLGYPMTNSEVSYGDWQSRQLTVVASLAYTHDDFVGAMAAIANGAVDVDALHSRTIGLDGLAGVLEELGSGTSTDIKVLVDPSRGA
ncbi:alcohol dehydrogenase [Prauserella marina]|uniref:(R,R)-butanediol dehydrogenase / meso-butanediol dehydrogenase / diacetyl reductase n=1 Tax=Prauserella marina TaxID=530584 RepID=A0A222VUN6_9PSEU|nr:zinc-binding dehydrogenase [Prauserella marina]ASR37656.1 alcohol dehydrogenase [Prauserella marina]PWV75578.1 (R,R)-butanediol dehydrogenase/meso-butanediol dehydrogenase/diacetyl reductase [Prauserella marina]SDD31437.1 (R,R)-butanediol dehydrogenase / meso-butanediol dehydrogenase / diacetyl reductase [Prauserella marina]